MRVHLFGLPISTHRRLRSESVDWKDAVPTPHVFRATPLSTNDQSVVTEGELEEVVRAVGEGFTHIIMAGNRNWKKVQDRLQFDCRVHIAKLWEPIKDISWELLRGRLHTAVAIDEVWLDKVSPRDLRHALLLPPTIFATTRNTDRYWNRCDVYVEERIPEAEALLSVVEKEHRRPDSTGGRSWLDDKKLRYKFDPSKHASSKAARDGAKEFRFCYEVIPGFHFDVRDERGGAFPMQIGGKMTKVHHCNITPWGHVRKG